MSTKLAPDQIIVHPLVLLSVVDHYNRAARATKKRVVGVLLGQWKGKTVNIANSYACGLEPTVDWICKEIFNSRATSPRTILVPFEEDEKDPSVWFLDHNYHEAMYDMFKKVNGTYSTRLKSRAFITFTSI